MGQKQNDFSIPFRPISELKKEANKFLISYNPEDTIPVPIEHIVEYDLKISIIPSKYLERDWGIDAFINSELNTIVIDEKAYMTQEERARFSVAHEVAHKVLHKDFYEKLEITDEKSYLDFQENGNLKTKSSMEFQAYTFAGYLLLPEKLFNPRFEELFTSLRIIDIDTLYQIMRILAEEFKVSGDCLQKQIQREFPEEFRSIMELKS